MRHRIIAIVEGHGEQTAVPGLLRRWFRHRRFDNFYTDDLAIRAPGSGALKAAHDSEDELGVEYYVEMAARERPAGILVLLDADDECIERAKAGRQGLGPELRERANRVAPHIPIEVVVADREYEAWFLAALPQMRRHLNLPAEFELPRGPLESVRDCKRRLRQVLGEPYEETVDQQRLTELLPFTMTLARRSRSYRRLLKALEALTQAARRVRQHRNHGG